MLWFDFVTKTRSRRSLPAATPFGGEVRDYLSLRESSPGDNPQHDRPITTSAKLPVTFYCVHGRASQDHESRDRDRI